MADPGDKYQPMVQFIRIFTRLHSYPPTVRELQLGLGLSSTSVVANWMWVLRNQERITWVDGQNRTVRVIGDEIIHLTYDEARMLRDLVGDADPKAVLMRAARDHANGLVPTATADGTMASGRRVG